MTDSLILQLKESISSSHFALILLTEDYVESLEAMVQLGMIIILDKPLFVLYEKNVHLPEQLRKLAVDVAEFGGLMSIEEATQKMLKGHPNLVDPNKNYSPHLFQPKPDKPSEN